MTAKLGFRAFLILGLAQVANIALLVLMFLSLQTVTGKIQAQRADFVMRGCVAQNARHDSTLAALREIDQRIEKNATPARRRQVEASAAATIILVNALAPRQDCRLAVALATHGS